MKLVICEKSSVAKTVSAVLGAHSRKDGAYEGNGYIVSHCVGHLLTLAEPQVYDEKYAKWRYADLPILPGKWQYTVNKKTAKQLRILCDLMKRPDVEYVINACDAGREGENIFRHVYNYAKCSKKIYRLWIASLESAAIRAGFDSLKDGAEYDNLYAAASSRERADWLVGYNATRTFSVLYGGVTLNVGRVQSPTLAMIVKRDADIAAFVKEPFYTPFIDCGSFTASGDRLKDRQAAEDIRDACDGKTAVVRSVERQKKSASPPALYDLTSLQRDANRILGFAAARTLEYAQSLYEMAVISYPRVDSRYITSDMRGAASNVVKWLQASSPFAENTAFTPDIDRLIGDKRVTDHHAIIPTAKITQTDLTALPSGERAVLNLIITRILCAVAPAHVYESVKATLDCEGYTFTARGKTVISDGWKAIESAFKASLKSKSGTKDDDNGDGDNDDKSLPELSERESFTVKSSVHEGFTQPPRPYTEDTLLSSMENAGVEDMPDNAERRGIGTPATRSNIIEKIIKSGFVERVKKSLISTDKGRNLIAVLPDSLTSPKLTAMWETRLQLVEKGELPEAEFMDSIAEFTKTIVAENSAPKPEFAGLFGGNGGRAASEPLGRCPRCNSPVREGGKGFFCDSGACGFALWKSSKFWTAKKKPLTADIVAALLGDGRVFISGLHSEKTGKPYNATILLDDSGDKWVNFKMEFEGKKS